jgi:hypothetical protein
LQVYDRLAVPRTFGGVGEIRRTGTSGTFRKAEIAIHAITKHEAEGLPPLGFNIASRANWS